MWGFLVIYAINPGKSCFSQNLHHIRISSQFVSFFLTRCQMRAHKTKTCLVQCHAYRYRSLQINYIILHQYKIKHIYRNYLTGTVTCVGFISVLISEKWLEREREREPCFQDNPSNHGPHKRPSNFSHQVWSRFLPRSWEICQPFAYLPLNST